MIDFSSGSSKRRHRYEKLSKPEAIELGVMYYWTGKACKRGHLDFRSTTSDSCVGCNSVVSAVSSNEKKYGGSKMLLIDGARLDRRLEKELYGYEDFDLND